MHVRRLRAAGAMVAAGALASSFVTMATATAAQASTRHTIANTHPAWATGARHVSASVPTGAITAQVYLASADPSGLAAYATAVSTPGNALYGQFLTAAQAQAKFAPTKAEAAAVTAWLHSAGLNVTGTTSGFGAYITVSGSPAQMSSAFAVTFGMFKGTDGNAYRAPTAAASVPSDVAADVAAVSGLSAEPNLVKPGDTLPPPGPNYWVAPPCSTYYGQKIATDEPKVNGRAQPWNNCGYTQAQIRDAYGVAASGETGKGVTVAVVDAYASPTMQADANQFAQTTGDRAFKPGQYSQHLITPFTLVDECGGNGWYGEESLDVEAVHGMAPDANVRYVGAASCDDTDLADAESYIVNNHVASIVTNSWGETADESTISPEFDQIFQAGATEGIGFYFSSGDSGYEDPAGEDPFSDQIQVDYPTSSPWVTSVGGTSLAIGPRGNYEWETGWGTLIDSLSSDGKSWAETPPGTYPDDYDGSGGGGVSTQYTQPAYQKGVVPSSLAHSLPDGSTSTTAMRVVPDVSALADPSTGMLVGETVLQPDGQTFAFSLSRIGGTSVACPEFAGIEADAQQAAGHALGFANPAIYQRHGTFNDVTDHPLGPGTLYEVRNNYTDPSTKELPLVTFLRALGINGEGAATLAAVRGYDDSTGIGSPTAAYIRSFKAHKRR